MISKIEGKHIVHVITGLNDGGAEAVLFRLTSADKLNNQHTILSLMDGGKYRPLFENAGFDVYSFGMSRGRMRFRSLFNLWRRINTLKPDLVQTWMYHADFLGGIASKLAGVKSIVWGLHSTYLDRKTTPLNTQILVRINKLLSYYVPKKIICCATSAKLFHDEIGFASKKTTVVPNGYDISKFSINEELRLSIRDEFKISKKDLCLGTVARFNPQKDHGNTLLACGLLKQSGLDFKILLVGPDMVETNDELVEMVAKNNLLDRTILVGPRPDIPSIMNGLDIHVLGSAYGEAFPNVICEAMSCGTICVATDVGDCGLIIGNTGLTCPPRDPLALSGAIQSLKGQVSRNSYSLPARERIVDNFSLKAMLQGYKHVWSQVL